jgi:tetratricopeptide (TPR) repeat protein
MKEPEVPEAASSPESNLSATALADSPAKAVEPLTAERVSAWNRYLDRYVVGGVLLLVLIASTRPIVSQSIWSLLRAGERISHGAPVTVDTLSFSREGKPWINIPWTFEVVNWQLFDLTRHAFESDVEPDRGDQAGASVLTLLNALLVVAAAALLMLVRRPGPGLWWVALCVMIALGGFVVPAGATGLAAAVGGLGVGKVTVDPRTWGILLFSIELLLLHRASNLGRRNALWFLPLVFLAWANADESFLIGALVLVGWMVGRVVDHLVRRGGDKAASGLGHVLAVGVVSLLITLANPSTYNAWLLAGEGYLSAFLRMFGAEAGLLTQDRISFFGALSQRYLEDVGGSGAPRSHVAFYLFVVWVGLMSFAVNWRQFSFARFLPFVLASVLWASQITLGAFFGMVLAACLALNGQEWYQSRFGVEGRLGWGWKLWSDGGRSATIVLLFVMLAIAITGISSARDEIPFGLGYDDTGLNFDTADAVRNLKLKGNVMNLSLAQGDALLWRAPEHKSFIDGRAGVFPIEMRKEIEELKQLLRKDQRESWGPLLDKFGGSDPGITALIVSPQTAQGSLDPVYQSLMLNPLWVPLYDGGNSVLFGRLDKPTPDLALFEANRLDPNEAVYKRGESPARPPRPPTATSWLDFVLRTRNLRATQPQVRASERWLQTGVSPQGLQEPARCFMAIRAARRALMKDPDDWRAYLQLHAAYSALMQSEANILAKTLDPSQVPVAYQAFRLRQQLAALNLAVETAPPAVDDQLRDQVGNLNLALANLYDRNRVLDMVRDRLQVARELLPASNFNEEFEQRFGQLNEVIEQSHQQIDNLTAERDLRPIQRFELAMAKGLEGMAIEELLNAENTGTNPALVRGFLVELYCKTGQPDKAFALIETTETGDPSLGTAPGIAAYRQGTVYFLLGYYDTALSYWEGNAVPQLRAAQSMQSLSAAQALLLGQPIAANSVILEITGTPGSPGFLAMQAEWEAEIGLCKLEAGILNDVKDERGTVTQRGVASHFKKALELQPNHPIRGLLEYYLEKLGEEVPPLVTEEVAAEKPAPDLTPNIPKADESTSNPTTDASTPIDGPARAGDSSPAQPVEKDKGESDGEPKK